MFEIMDVIESTWKVKLIMRNGSVLEGVYIGDMNDSDEEVGRALLGVSVPGLDPKYSYSRIYKDESMDDTILFRVGDVSSIEISPLL